MLKKSFNIYIYSTHHIK